MCYFSLIGLIVFFETDPNVSSEHVPHPPACQQQKEYGFIDMSDERSHGAAQLALKVESLANK